MLRDREQARTWYVSKRTRKRSTKTHLADNLVRETRIVPETLYAVPNVEIPGTRGYIFYGVRWKWNAYGRTYLATLTGFPLLRDSSSASSCASRSIRSASLLRRRDRSNPVTFLPHVVVNAFLAARTATSMSFAEPSRERTNEDRGQEWRWK